jgi:hypothetical protein
MRGLVFALTFGIVVAAPVAAEPRLRQCGFSYSTDRNHAAMFTWRGGDQVELVVCDFSCSSLRAYDRSIIRSYRWEAPGVLVVFDTRTRVRQPIATYRGIRAFAAPASAANGLNVEQVRIGRSTCSPPENIIAEERLQP